MNTLTGCVGLLAPHALHDDLLTVRGLDHLQRTKLWLIDNIKGTNQMTNSNSKKVAEPIP